MDILQIAIDAEGGVGKLADALGVRQNVVSNWRTRGLPKPWGRVLQLQYAAHLPRATVPMHTGVETAAGQGA